MENETQEQNAEPLELDPLKADKPSSRWLTLPNLITTIRILGSPAWLCWRSRGKPRGWPYWQFSWCSPNGWTAFSLAVYESRRRSVRLDTIADAVFYSSLLVAVVLLSPNLIGREAVWIVVAVAGYLCSWLASWVKFRCLPSYHTWAAKGVWVVVGTGIICLLGGISPWPFRVAMVCVALTNLEATLITFELSQCKVDVPSLWHARRDNKMSR